MDVRHSDELHAKVYRFASMAVVGSANASGNGLGFEGAEAGWREASYVVESEQDLARIDAWFKARWAEAKKVTATDLEAADRNFQRNRSRRAALSVEPGTDLIDLLRSRPELFVDRPIYLVCSTDGHSTSAKRYIAKRNAESDLNIDSYDNWKPPTDAVLFDFTWYTYPKGSAKFEGLYRSRKDNKPKIIKGEKIYEVDELEQTTADDLPIIITSSSVSNQLTQWADIIKLSVTATSDCWNVDGCSIQFDRLAQQLSGQHRVPVLNVLDEKKRFKIDAEGFGLSGNWTGPDKLPNIIRVYHERGGPSVAGGKIVGRDPTENHRVIIRFQLDPAQVGRPSPARFRPNGCVQTFDE